MALIELAFVASRPTVHSARGVSKNLTPAPLRALFRSSPQAMSLVTDHKRLAHVTDPHLQGEYPFRDVSHVAAIAAMCLQPEPTHRPLMADIVTSLLGIVGSPRTAVPSQERGVRTRGSEGGKRTAPQMEEVGPGISCVCGSRCLQGLTKERISSDAKCLSHS